MGRKRKKEDDELEYNAGDVIAGFFKVGKDLASDLNEWRKKKREKKSLKDDVRDLEFYD